MKLYGIEKLSLVDYDGKLCATVFTGACNFRCPFCHNGPLVDSLDKLQAENNEEIMDFLKSRIGILDAVCITGGEPTLNHDLPDFCKQVKDLGYLVKLDTNGTNPQMVKTLTENQLIDYVAMDIKNAKDNYSAITGLQKIDTNNIEQTVEYLMNCGIDYEFRTTLINEYHTQSDILKIAEWIQGANKYFLQKFKEVDTCLTKNLNAVEQAKAEKFLEIIKPFIPSVKLRGY